MTSLILNLWSINFPHFFLFGKSKMVFSFFLVFLSCFLPDFKVILNLEIIKHHFVHYLFFQVIQFFMAIFFEMI